MKKLFINQFIGFKSGDSPIFAQWLETQDDGWLIWESGYVISQEPENDKNRNYWFDFNEKDEN